MGKLLDNPESRRQLAEYVQGRLAKLRLELESLTLDERKSDVLRGRIAELKSIASAITNEAANE